MTEICESGAIEVDIMGALGLASQTIKIARDLRDIERDLDSAGFKAQMAELYGNLADIKMALSDAKEDLHEKDAEIKKLQAEIKSLKSGETCPLCQSGQLKVTSVVNDPTFGIFGHKQHTLTCQNEACGHRETRKVVPPER
ncbi:hypothetical protein [Agrobacterium tumefaciens]|nr:hypothetical protein [Agrobacterium tumefaciens]UXU04236.1 hypothetical protein FY128_02145 [Agrobacterium tumefaciens]